MILEYEFVDLYFNSASELLKGCQGVRTPSNAIVFTTRTVRMELYRQRVYCQCLCMVALPNIGAALCSTPQSLVDAHYKSAVQ